MKNRSFWILTLSLAAFMLLIHLATCSNYELHRDEMLYISFGSHLSWGFASTPPFISFLSFIIIHIFGYKAFFVKLFPALFGAFMVILIALFTRELGGKRLAVFLACFAAIISTAMLRTASLFMPVIFELFFWMLFLYFLLKLVTTQNPVYWIWVGISFGLAFLNKYSVLFLGFSTFIALLISEHRKLLLSKYFLFAIAAALIIMSPNIIWQLRHNLAVATHMKELYRTQLVYVSPKTFLLDQVIMNFSAILIWGTGLTGILFFSKERKFRIFGYILLLVIMMFLVARGKSYYTLGVYPMMFAIGEYILEKYLRKSVIAAVAISSSLECCSFPLDCSFCHSNL
ncbi:MAG: glycosyltransferase family 39 protein [Bacteroidales bacterium]|jgi:4-amino-4-deoxy-L-arabinose transferase-like glycosyltransferase